MQPSAKLNVALLLLCQSSSVTSSVLLVTTAALIGKDLAPVESIATLPLALKELSTMVTTIPASLLMAKLGRRWGFTLGACLGMLGGGLGMWAIALKSFALFCASTALIGAFLGFAAFYRFAAAEAATAVFRAQAISLVIGGGVLGAIAGPNLATLSRGWFVNNTYMGAIACIVGLQVLAIALLQGVSLHKPQVQQAEKGGRSVWTIVRQPIFVVAVLGSMASYSTMALIMTATPLAMVADAHPFERAATVIQWHVLGMFVPSFFTGWLIRRLGVIDIIVTGACILLTSIAIDLLGSTFSHYWWALLLLGVGWNFMFVGSSSLLTGVYEPEEQTKTQAVHDFMMFGLVAMSTLASGQVFHYWGWATVNWLGVPMVSIALIATLLLRWRRGYAQLPGTVGQSTD